MGTYHSTRGRTLSCSSKVAIRTGIAPDGGFPARRFVVVSACGRRFKGDTKVTDLLYLVNAHVKYHVSCEELLEDIGQRYFDIADELELTYPIREEFAA